MAKASIKLETYVEKDIQRKGVHSKNKTSVSKSSKNYKKPYKGQGR